MSRVVVMAVAIAGLGVVVAVATGDARLVTIFAVASASMLGVALGAAFTRRGDLRELRLEFPASGVRRELARARRHGTPAVLIRVSGPRNGQLHGAMAGIGPTSRDTDLAWISGASGYLLLTHTTRDVASVVAGRLRQASPLLAGARLDAAAFPEDGLSFGGLLAALQPLDIPSSPPVGMRAGVAPPGSADR